MPSPQPYKPFKLSLRKQFYFAAHLYWEFSIKPKIEEISDDYHSSQSLDAIGNALQIPNLVQLYREDKETELARELTNQGLVKMIFRSSEFMGKKYFCIELDVEDPKTGKFETHAGLSYHPAWFGFSHESSQLGGEAIYNRTTNPAIREIAFRASDAGIAAVRAKYTLQELERNLHLPGLLNAFRDVSKKILHTDRRSGFAISFQPGVGVFGQTEAGTEKEGFRLRLQAPNNETSILSAQFKLNATNGRFANDTTEATVDENLLLSVWIAKDKAVRTLARTVLREKPRPQYRPGGTG